MAFRRRRWRWRRWRWQWSELHQQQFCERCAGCTWFAWCTGSSRPARYEPGRARSSRQSWTSRPAGQPGLRNPGTAGNESRRARCSRFGGPARESGFPRLRNPRASGNESRSSGTSRQSGLPGKHWGRCPGRAGLPRCRRSSRLSSPGCRNPQHQHRQRPDGSSTVCHQFRSPRNHDRGVRRVDLQQRHVDGPA